ncbi:MAG TPA: Lrp/AsnC ligand binding domain-containing protein [Fimbriimonadaceae bacterium]|nr:Lrp/AsnC ligand binding domain-containing protein [Fimbriimonadaceae bacterium]
MASSDFAFLLDGSSINERIFECHDIAGEDTFILKVRCASPEDLRDLLLCIRAQPQFIRTISSVVLVVVKEPGLPHLDK